MSQPFWSLSIPQVLDATQSTTTGLSTGEAEARLQRAGSNIVGVDGRLSAARLFIRQFKSPLALILVFGAAISLLLGDTLDALIILLIVGGSGLLSFTQEYRASRSIAALRDRLALTVRVLRDGKAGNVLARELVSGDVVLLSAGSLVPADGLVLEARDCLVTEAALTGESMPVEKRPGLVAAEATVANRTNTLFMGSSLRSGTATLLVVETGPRTELGEIAARIGELDEDTDFERGVRKFGIMLMRVMILIVLGVLTINQLLDRPIAESLLFAVALAVGLSPELLPAIISVTLAAGARHLAEGGVIVRRLDAIENLGSMDILCTDKTGTLTEGVARLHSAIGPEGSPSAEVFRSAFVNATFETGITNPLDEAIIIAGRGAGLSTGSLRKLDEIPYDFVRRRLSIVVKDDAKDDHGRIVTKGAFAEVLSICDRIRDGAADRPMTSEERCRIEALFQQKSQEGYRVLALASRELDATRRIAREDEMSMTLLGLLLFLDPPKSQVAETIRNLADLGIATKIISGDNRYVTAHVAAQVGLNNTAPVTGDELSAMSNDALRYAVEQTTVFAEIDPQQKERIIHALQQAGHAVGYLGDGINDAPALHLADVGISVDTAVDVARESADMVLLRRDLDVLRRGVLAGRRTFANTLKYISITTSANFGNMVSMAVAAPLLPFLPLLPKQILLNNFLSDIPSVAISTDNVDAEHLDVPQRWSISSVRRFMIIFGCVSSAFDILTFTCLLWVFNAGESLFQTIWFQISLQTELAVVLVLRTRRLFLRSHPSKLLLWSTVAIAAVGLGVPFLPGMNVLFGFVTPSWQLVTFSLAIVAAYVAATEVTKKAFYYLDRPK